MSRLFDAIASRTWGHDDDIDLTSSDFDVVPSPEAKAVPRWYKEALRAFLEDHPLDTQFIITLGDGAGYGSLICTEEGCYSDVVLGPDHTCDDGGLARGFGAFDEYANHTRDKDHIAARDERVGAAAPPPKASTSFAAPPVPKYSLPKVAAVGAVKSDPAGFMPSGSGSKRQANAVGPSGGSLSRAKAETRPPSFLSSSSAAAAAAAKAGSSKRAEAFSLSDSSSPPPSPLKKPLPAPDKAKGTKGKKRPVPVVLELSSDSDDFDTGTLDKFLGVPRGDRLAKPVRRAPRREIGGRVEPDVKGKGRAVVGSTNANAVAGSSTAGAAQYMRPPPALAAAAGRPGPMDGDADHAHIWALRDAALARGDQIGAEREREQLAAAAAPNAVAGPYNAFAPAAAVALPAPMPAVPYISGRASEAELRLIKEEYNALLATITKTTDLHPTWKAFNPSWVRVFDAFKLRLRSLTVAINSRSRITPFPVAELVLPPTVEPPVGAIGPLHQVVIHELGVRVELLKLTADRLRLASEAAVRAAAAPAPGAALPNLGYNGTLGGAFGAINNLYDAGAAALANLANADAGYYGAAAAAADPYAGHIQSSADLKNFLDVAAEAFEHSHEVAEAAKALGLKDHTTDKLPGLEILLMPHQIAGVAWMHKQELNKRMMGGILADDMGLGKTVQAIAIMVLNTPREGRPKTNLIVCPFALIDQWKLEIQSKCKDKKFRIHVQHGKDKIASAKGLSQYDVVITTYATLVQDFPDERKHDKARKKKQKARDDLDNFVEHDTSIDEHPLGRKGPLAEIEFHRVILDEAQQIRNRTTRGARACFEIKAVYRWCLTGTPVTNGLDDLFSLLKFLNVRPFNDWKEFKAHISKNAKRNPSLAANRAQAILRSCLLRRNKDSKIDGVPILTLKPKHVEQVLLEFSPDERKTYDILEKRSRATFNKFLKKGTVMKNYTQVLTLLLRLRQACNHPILLTRAKSEMLPGDQQILDDEPPALAAAGALGPGGADALLARAVAERGQAWVDKLKATLLERAVAAGVAEYDDADVDEDEYTCTICFEDIRAIDNGEEIVLACSHRYCRTCIADVFQQQQVNIHANDHEDVGAGGKKPCPTCRTPFDLSMVYPTKPFEPEEEVVRTELRAKGKLNDDEDDDDEGDANDKNLFNFARDDADMKPFISRKDDAGVGSPSDKTLSRGKGKAKSRVLDSDDDDFAAGDKPVFANWWEQKDRISSDPKHRKHREKLYEMLGLEPEDVIHPSTKMVVMLDEIKRVMAEHPEDKIICYSQWTSMLDLVSDFLRKEKISYDLYDGRMNREEREDVIKAFNVQNNPRVLCISLKCGGVGLNLVRANRVINLDLAWNAATETQARDRVHRLGQQKEVFVRRLIIADTVEQRILALQEKKQKESDAALGEGTGARLKKHSVAELKELFGGN